jgi:hypothetical protein
MGEDRMLFNSIKFDEETLIVQEEKLSTMFNCLSLSPSVLDISHIEYMPMVGDIWNGTDFIGNLGISKKEKKFMGDDYSYFSFIVNDVHLFYATYSENDFYSKLIASALKSNPVIKYEDIDV